MRANTSPTDEARRLPLNRLGSTPASKKRCPGSRQQSGGEQTSSATSHGGSEWDSRLTGMTASDKPVLYAIVTGATAARDVGKLVELAHSDGWEVCVIASPNGMRFIDSDALAAQTGHPVRSQYKDPGSPDVLPAATAMIVAPITSNSLAKWAAGISDTLPLGLLVEGVGKGLPIVAVPFLNSALASFPAVAEALRNLGKWGVALVLDEQHEPHNGEDRIASFPWRRALDAVANHPRFRNLDGQPQT